MPCGNSEAQPPAPLLLPTAVDSPGVTVVEGSGPVVGHSPLNRQRLGQSPPVPASAGNLPTPVVFRFTWNLLFKFVS